MSIIAFTSLPYDLHHWLGGNNSNTNFSPNKILVLGGGGMPSESNLIRLYYAVKYSERFPDAKIIVAHPIDTLVAKKMRTYLIENGIDSLNISLMLKGTNTREQAMEFINFQPGVENGNLAIITSPENMYRTLSVFKKLNYKNIEGISAYENAMFVDLKYSHKKLGGKLLIPDVSENLGLRYNFWNYFKLEITCLRELTAIFYYKINGWI